MGLSLLVHTAPKTSNEKLTLIVVEIQQLLNGEKTDSKKENSCLKWTLQYGRRKACANFQTDIDYFNIVVHRYRNTLYLKYNEFDLKLSKNLLLLAKRICLLSYFGIFHKQCIVLIQTTGSYSKQPL